MSDVQFSINSNIMRKAVAASMARQALGKIIEDGVGTITVFYDADGVLHVTGSHGGAVVGVQLNGCTAEHEHHADKLPDPLPPEEAPEAV